MEWMSCEWDAEEVLEVVQEDGEDEEDVLEVVEDVLVNVESGDPPEHCTVLCTNTPTINDVVSTINNVVSTYS